MTNAKRDENRVPTILFVTDDGNSTPVRGIVDPITGRLKCSAVFSSGALTDLNGLTASSQTFSTGTSGTDFNISSSGSVHTFNIPTASAVSRGLLSAADYSTFSAAAAGIGTVTTVSVVTANGISGTVANPTTTPAITLILGAITPTSVNGLTITTTNGTLTLANGSSLVTSGGNSITLTSTGATNVTLPTSGTLYGTAADSITSAQLASSLTNETGTGVVVFSTSPTLVTPVLGVATATSINKLTITAPATGSTLTIADGKTLTVSNTLTFTGTDASSVAFGAGGTVVYTSNKISALSATSSAELAGVISDESGSGLLVFNNSPIFITPTLGVASATSLTLGTALSVANGGTGQTSFTDGGVIIGNAGNALAVTTAGTSGQVLTSNGAGNDPSFQTFTGVAPDTKVGNDSFNPSSTASTKVIAHGLGKALKFFRMDWGVAAALTYPSNGYGHVLYNGTTQADLNHARSGAGNQAIVSGFNVKNDNVNDTVDWVGVLTSDDTNVTISVPTFNATANINFTWMAY